MTKDSIHLKKNFENILFVENFFIPSQPIYLQNLVATKNHASQAQQHDCGG
jgi:hypothetical protein